MSSDWNWEHRENHHWKGDKRPNENPESRPRPDDRFRPNAPQPHHPVYPNPTTRKPGNSNNNIRPISTSSGLGTTGIVFIALGSTIVVIVIILCIVLSCRRSNSRRNIGSTSTNSIQYVVGRGISRPSFLSFRYSRHANEPIVVNYPDPDTHLPNYPIQTPYTFSSTTSLAQQGNSQPPPPGPQNEGTTNIENGKNHVPSQRATIY